MKKKVFGSLFALIAVILFSPLAFATDSSNACGENAHWSLSDGVLTISGTGETADYEEYTPWYYGDQYLTVTSAVIEDGITGIGMGLFANCVNLTEVRIPESVTSFGYGAFKDCMSLKEVTIPGKNVVIGDEAFYDCLDLETVTVTGSVSEIGESAFSMERTLFDQGYQMALSSAVFPGEHIQVGASAFRYCGKLKNVSFPGSVSNIERFAFSLCSSLDMPMPSGLQYLGTGAYLGCMSLKEVNLPQSLLLLGIGAFTACEGLESVTLPEGLSNIQPQVFNQCVNLKTIFIPGSVEEIGAGAFEACDALETVYYSGTGAQWTNIKIGDENEPLKAAKLQTTDAGALISYNLEHRVSALYERDFQNGEYTIQLEDNPFFPYEIQFTSNGQTRAEWFMDENDSVSVDGYTFRVKFSGAARKLSFRVGNDVVSAYPESKKFDNTGTEPTASKLPVENFRLLRVNLYGYLWSELKEVSLGEIPNGYTAWAAPFRSMSSAMDDYTKVDDNYRFDLSSNYVSAYEYAIVIGTSSPVDSNNLRYEVFFYVPGIQSSAMSEGLMRIEMYGGNETRKAAEVASSTFLSTQTETGLINLYTLNVYKPAWNEEDAVFLNMDFGTEELREREELEVTIYEGAYASEADAVSAGAKDITAQIWRQTDMTHSGGYQWNGFAWDELTNPSPVTLVVKRGQSIVETLFFGFWARAQYVDFNRGRDYLYEGTESWREHAAGYIDHSFDENGEHTLNYGLYDSGASARGAYYLSLRAYRSGLTTEDYERDYFGLEQVRKAALGRFTSQVEFDAAPDIKESLFYDAEEPGGGYLADFSGGPVTFTIQDVLSDTLNFVTVTLKEADKTEKIAQEPPVAFRKDRYFRLEDAANENHDAPRYSWPIDYRDDSYYYHGYQTVFQIYGTYDYAGFHETQIADGSAIYPRFFSNPIASIYAGRDVASGTKQVSGETQAVFHPNQPVRYSAAMNDGAHLKNYWVTVVTPTKDGAKLFVNAASNIDDAHRDAAEQGPDGKGLPVREVFLDSRYDYHHDIMIANTGDAQLRGLSVKLVGDLRDENVPAQNVRLDEHWTLGADGVSVLAAFDYRAIAFKSRYGGGCDNMTKIRLLPVEDENGKIQEGEISGYLVITSANGGSMTIKLTGEAGEPRIVTETLETVSGHDFNAVQYVHYSTFLQTSSMYAKDKVAFRVMSGQLPKGVAGQNLDVTLKSNGELYGVPEETGEFTFTVRATFYGDENAYSEKTYTLRVADNSTLNVWEINDYQDSLTVNEKAVSGATPAEYDVDTESVLKIHSQAEFSEFVDRVTVDGVELDKSEYSVDQGSIIATVRSQTLRNATNGSTHTISLENRANKDLNAKMTRTSVNVTVKKSANSGSGSSGGGGSSSSGGSSSGGGGSSSSSGGSSRKSTLYSISVKTPSNGSLTIDRKSATSGTTVTITAHPKDGYALDSVTVTDSAKKSVTVNGSGETRTFTMPPRRVTVSATFVRLYRVGAMTLNFGWVEVKPEGAVRPGTRITLTAHPENGYKTERLRAYVGDAPLSVTDNGDGTATFIMPSDNVEASADFTPIPPIEQFTDLQSTDWFYNDAAWALERGVMNGVTAVMWSPQDNISTATVVVTLARLQMGDQTNDILKEFESDIYAESRPWLPDSGQWYYLEARWAAASGILTENVFTGREPLSRAGFAVILSNYLRYRGVKVEIPEPYEFSDGALIETCGAALGEDLNSAFQILREANVFRGDQTNAMLPNNHSTRAHMAALLHRLSDYIIKMETAKE